MLRSQVYDAEIRIEHAKILGIRCGHVLSGSPSADDHMGVHDVDRAARREKPADARRVNPAKGDDISGRLPHQAGEPHLAGRRPDNLSERRRRDRDAGSGLAGSGQQDEDAAVVAVECEKGAGVYGDARHQAAVLAADE
jgi:hypothetical protein